MSVSRKGAGNVFQAIRKPLRQRITFPIEFECLWIESFFGRGALKVKTSVNKERSSETVSKLNLCAFFIDKRSAKKSYTYGKKNVSNNHTG